MPYKINPITGKHDYYQSGSSGSSVYSKNVAYVDPGLGSDSTGQVNNRDLPYATVNAASSAVSSVSVSHMGSTDLVILLQGDYTELVYLTNGIDIHCEAGVVFSEGGFTDLVSTAKNVRITGMAKFVGEYCSILFINSDAKVYMEFDSAEGAGSLCQARGAANVSMKFRNAKVNAYFNNGAGTCMTFRDTAVGFIEATEYIQSQHYVAFFKAGNTSYFSGSVTIKAPKLEIINDYTASYGSAQRAVIAIDRTYNAKINIIGDIVYSNTTYADNAVIITNQVYASNSVFNFYGNIYGNISKGIYSGYQAANCTMNIYGNVYSTSTAPLQCDSAAGIMNIHFHNSIISGPYVSTLAQGKHIKLRDCQVYNSAGANAFWVNGGGTASSLYAYNTQSQIASGLFIGNGNTTGFTVGCINTQCNYPFGPGTDTWGGFTQVATMKVIQTT